MDPIRIITYVLYIFALLFALILVAEIKSLKGRGWLIATIAFTLVLFVLNRASYMVASYFLDLPNTQRFQVYQMLALFPMIGVYGSACFAMFLFVQWSKQRINLTTVKNLFSFSGRLPRSGFWILYCILLYTNNMPFLIAYQIKLEGVLHIIFWSIAAVLFLPLVWVSLAVYAKRWHDQGKSGWMSLIILIPIAGPFIMLALLGFVKGDEESNQYGANPLKVDA